MRAVAGLGPTHTSNRSPARPGLPDALGPHVAAHLRVHPVGGAPERELAKRDEVPQPEETLQGVRGLVGHVHLALSEPLLQHVRREIHQLDLVGSLKHRVGHRLTDGDPGDLRDDVVQALEMLDVQRSPDVDAGGEQLLDVLPPLGVAGTRGVGMCELIHQQQRRPAGKRGV